MHLMENDVSAEDLRVQKSDSISSVQVQKPGLIPDAYCISATDWSGLVEVHSLRPPPSTPTSAVKYQYQRPLLCHCWEPGGGARLFCGAGDGVLFALDLASSKSANLGGKHDKPVKALVALPESKRLVSGSWDGTIGLWDARAGNPITRINANERIYAMDAVEPLLVVALANRAIKIIDLRKPSDIFDSRMVNAKYQTRDVATFSDRSGYATASIAGEISVEHVLKDDRAARDYTFNVSSKTRHIGASVNPFDAAENRQGTSINSVLYEPQTNVLVTGGSDGWVHYWDKQSGKLLNGSIKAEQGILAMGYNGEVLAYGCGYDWGRGSAGRPQQENPYLAMRPIRKKDAGVGGGGSGTSNGFVSNGWGKASNDHSGFRTGVRGRGRGRGGRRGRGRAR